MFKFTVWIALIWSWILRTTWTEDARLLKDMAVELCVAQEGIWFDQSKYEEAEARYEEIVADRHVGLRVEVGGRGRGIVWYRDLGGGHLVFLCLIVCTYHL